MTNKFKYKQIKELSKQIRGVTYKKSDISEIPKDGYIPLLRANNINDRSINYEKLVFIKQESVKSEQVLQDSDILIATSSGSKSLVGKSAQFYINKYEKVSFGAFCKVVRPYYTDISPKYLGYFFQSEIYRRNINKVVSGSNINNLRNEHIDKQKLIIPDIEKQNKLVNVIEGSEAILRKRQQQIEALSDLKQSLFLKLYSNNEVETQSLKLSELILSSRNGLSRRSNDLDGEIVLKLKDIRENKIDYTEVNRISLTERELNTYKLNDQDLLLVRVNGNPDYVGRCAIFEGYKEIVFFNDHIIRLEIDNSINKYFLAYYLNSHYGLSEFRKQIKTSAGQYTISRNGVDNLNIVYPNLPIQDKLISQFKEINKMENYLLKSLKMKEDLFHTILHQAFNGELLYGNVEV